MKTFHIQQPPKPRMAYGYYTPLLQLNKEVESRKKEPTPTKNTKKVRFDIPDKPKSVLLTKAKVLKPHFDSEKPTQKTSYFKKSTMLAFAATAITAVTTLALFSDRLKGSAQKGSHFSAQSGESALTTLQSTITSIFSYFSGASAAPFPSIEVLEVSEIRETQNTSLSLREENPNFFPGASVIVPFFANELGKVTSSFGKMFLLAASEGEPPKHLLPFCNEGWCMPLRLTEQSIENQLRIQDEEEFFRGAKEANAKELEKLNNVTATNEAARKKLEEDKAANKKELVDLQNAYSKYVERLKNKKEFYEKEVPDLLKVNWFRELNASTLDVQNGFQYTYSPKMNGFNESKVKDVTRNEYAYKADPTNIKTAHEERSEASFSNRQKEFIYMKFVRSSHQIGPRASRWNNLDLKCKKAGETITCSTIMTPLDHKAGELRYEGTEEKVSSSCSIIKEKLSIKDQVIEKIYALDPRKHLPYFMTKFVVSSEFLKYKTQTPYSLMFSGGKKEKVDAKVTIPTSFPDLPTTCEELNA